MQKRKINGKIFAAWIVAALMLVSVGLFSGAVQAGETAGTISMQLPEDSENVEISLYTVATYKNGVYSLTKDFADSKLEISDLNNTQKVQELLKGLKEFADIHKLSGTEAKPDKDGLVKFTGLVPGLYMAAQSEGEENISIQPSLIPIPCQGEDGKTTYDAVIIPKYEYPGGDTLVTKLDDEGYAVPGAEFTLEKKTYLPAGSESGGENIYFWKEYATNLVSDENGQIVIRNMPKGDYRLVEVKVPEGFVKKAETKYFSVNTYGKVTEKNGVYVSGEGKVTEVTVTNKPTSLRVEKVDPDGNQLPGAKLMVKTADGGTILDKDGNPLYIFTSAEEPVTLKGLPAGEYLVTELEAPEGFKISPDVKVTVSDSADADNHVTITDEKEEPTKYSLTVQKDLTDLEGVPVFARDGVFYVALFSDAEYTRRVSSVMPVRFHGESSSSVTFRNLTKGMTYYVGETDEFGNYMKSDMENTDDDTYCVPIYPEDSSVTVDAETGEMTYSFENVFIKIPDGFFYNAEVIVTKKVLKGTEKYKTDAVYYCALFSDKECTDRIGDVAMLDMDGNDETSVTIPVSIGDSQETVLTYYIRETDENGVPLENTEELGFTVKQDKEKVELSYLNNQAEVVITNTYDENSTPTPMPTPSGTPTPGITGTPGITHGTTPGGNTPSSSRTSPKTGDNTTIALYVFLLVIAAAAAAFIFIRKRKKQ